MSWLSSLFGGGDSNYSNPANSAMGYLNQIPGQYTNPDYYNTIASQYKESPGFEHKLKRAMGAVGNAAAAGGMSGSLAHQQSAADTAEDLASKDFEQYLADRLGISRDMAGLLGTKAQYGYAGQAGQNQQHSNMLGNLGSLFGGALGAFSGGIPGFMFGASQGGNWLK